MQISHPINDEEDFLDQLSESDLMEIVMGLISEPGNVLNDLVMEMLNPKKRRTVILRNHDFATSSWGIMLSHP